MILFFKVTIFFGIMWLVIKVLNLIFKAGYFAGYSDASEDSIEELRKTIIKNQDNSGE